MTVLITLTTAGTDSGPFNLYTDIDGYTTPFETAVLKTALTGGYTSTLVPDLATIIRVTSTGSCINHTDITLVGTTTTTSTTTTPVYTYKIADCLTGDFWTLDKTYIKSIGDVIEYQIGVPGIGIQQCGTIVDDMFIGVADASFYSSTNRICGDTIHCPA